MNFHKIKDEEDIIFSPLGHLVDSQTGLKKGFFKVKNGQTNPMGPFIPKFSPIKEGDGLIHFENGTIKKVLSKFENFFSEEVKDKYKDLRMTHKMGIILHGKPGTGKTALAQLIMLKAIDKYAAVCLDCTNVQIDIVMHVLEIVRRYTTAPIIVFYDEFEMVCNNYRLLTFLDGAESINNCIFIGCTNFIGTVPNRIKNRKSRIKHLFEIKNLESTVYREFISKKLPKASKEVLDEFVYKVAEAELTLDEVKNAIIDYYVEDVTIDVAIEEVKKQAPDGPGEETEKFNI